MKTPKDQFTPENDRKAPELRMTSMIDVIFLLLIFFVFTANFNEIEKLLPTNLSLPGRIENPDQAPQESRIIDEIRIRIEPDGKTNGDGVVWNVNRRRCSTEKELRDALATLSELTHDIPVVIDPVESVPIERVLDVYDLCRLRGLTKIQFAVKSENNF